MGLHGGSEVRGDVGYGETCTLLAAVLVVERRLRRGVVGVAGAANSGAVVVVVAIAILAVSIFFLSLLLLFFFFGSWCGEGGCFGPGEAKRGGEREKNKSKRAPAGVAVHTLFYREHECALGGCVAIRVV